MPVTITDVDEFTDPITAPAGADVANAASVVAPVQKLANRTRWNRNRLGAHIPESGGNAGEFLYAPAKSRTMYIGPSGGESSSHYLAGGTVATLCDLSAGERWQIDTLVAFGAGPGGADVVSENGLMRCSVAALGYVKDISHELRSGMGLTGFGARLTPGVAEATASERMQLALFRKTIAGGTVTTMGAIESDGTNTVQIASVPAFTHTVNRNVYTYHALVRSSVNAPSTKDLLHAFIVAWTDVGPRNF